MDNLFLQLYNENMIQGGTKMAVYDPKSMKAEEFINDEEIRATLAYAEANKNNLELIDEILEKARPQKTATGYICAGLSHREASVLLACENPERMERMYEIAEEIKLAFYGNRIVIFAPLYLSNYCVNGCVYCPYHMKNKHIPRKKLTQEEVKAEVIALQENDNQSLAVGMIYLDNYDEALESIEEVRRSLLMALIDRKVNKYIAAVDGICKKLEKDKYLVILRKQAVTQLQSNRFDLMDDVKTVNIGNEMAVTVSIGIGLGGLTYSQNYEFARTSVDLALGRGGDQAVVKTPERIAYYGGKSQQVEKSTRVKARVKAHALREIITAKDSVIIMGHRIADVDSYGAAVGLYRIAKSLDRKAHIVLNQATTSVKPLVDLFVDNENYETDMIVNSAQALELPTSNAVLIVVDVNKPSLTECPDLLKLCKSIVVLDHHRQGSETIENATLSYVEAYASSTCEMVSEILQYINDGVKVRSDEADCMYSGIMIDTNNFMSKTGVRTFEAAAFLRRCGADVTRVRKLFRDDAVEYKTKADAVSQAEIYRNDYAISVCKSDDIESPTIVGAQAAN